MLDFRTLGMIDRFETSKIVALEFCTVIKTNIQHDTPFEQTCPQKHFFVSMSENKILRNETSTETKWWQESVVNIGNSLNGVPGLITTRPHTFAAYVRVNRKTYANKLS